MKKLISLFLSLCLILSFFAVMPISVSAASDRYIVDMIYSGDATLTDTSTDAFQAPRCQSSSNSVQGGTQMITDGTVYSKGFRYHAASGGSARNIVFTMPAGYNTVSGVVGVCSHVPGVTDNPSLETAYLEKCYLAVTVNSKIVYTSPDIKCQQEYHFNIRADEGSNVIIGVINPTDSGYNNHIIFGDPKLTYTEYPDVKVSFDKSFYRDGETAKAVVTGSADLSGYTAKWYIDGTEIADANGTEYTVKTADMGKTLSYEIRDGDAVVYAVDTFLSKIPIVSINTETGADVTSKEKYIDADFKVLNNNGEYEYNGLTEIKGRGNTSWGFPKKSYRLKLDSKANLFGFGKSKHWTLISCYWDENFLRNKMSYDISGEMGLTYAASEWVDVYLNGNYHGVYLLCEHLRVDDDRVEIYDWESTAEDIADAIAEAEPEKVPKASKLEDYMVENLEWITKGYVTFNDYTYTIYDYYNEELPSINGGYFIEMDTHMDETTSVRTSAGVPIMFKSPEFLNSNQTMLDEIMGYLNAVEAATISNDFTTFYKGERVHYTDLCDLDSMVKWWLVNEVFFNWDAGYNSNFMYKDIDGKLMFGPVWDMDITAGGYGTSNLYDQWQTWFYKRSDTMNIWFKEAVADPVFLMKARDLYWQYRDLFESMIATNGYMEKSHDLLYESGVKNSEIWKWRVGYEKDYQVMLQWIKDRLDWLDSQFETEQSLISSMAAQTSASGVTNKCTISPYTNSTTLTLTPSGNDLKKDDSLDKLKSEYTSPATSNISITVASANPSLNSISITVNGKLVSQSNITLQNSTATVEVSSNLLSKAVGDRNIIVATAYNTAGDVSAKKYLTIETAECPHTTQKTVGYKAATCKAAGYTGDKVCTACNVTVKKGSAIAKKAHSPKTTTVKATTSKKGYIKYTCSACGAATASTKTIYAAKNIKLSTTQYTYNGKTRKPSVTVRDYKGRKISSSNYTVTNKGGKKVGKYKVIIKFKGNYSGTKTLYFTINPKGVKMSKLSTPAKKQIKATWKKSSSVSGYQIQYSTSKKFKSAKKVTVKKYKTTSTTIKKLSSKKTYYVRVRTYKTVSGKKYYSAWSSYKYKKTK